MRHEVTSITASDSMNWLSDSWAPSTALEIPPVTVSIAPWKNPRTPPSSFLPPSDSASAAPSANASAASTDCASEVSYMASTWLVTQVLVGMANSSTAPIKANLTPRRTGTADQRARPHAQVNTIAASSASGITSPSATPLKMAMRYFSRNRAASTMRKPVLRSMSFSAMGEPASPGIAEMSADAPAEPAVRVSTLSIFSSMVAITPAYASGEAKCGARPNTNRAMRATRTMVTIARTWVLGPNVSSYCSISFMGTPLIDSRVSGDCGARYGASRAG